MFRTEAIKTLKRATIFAKILLGGSIAYALIYAIISVFIEKNLSNVWIPIAIVFGAFFSYYMAKCVILAAQACAFGQPIDEPSPEESTDSEE